MELELIPLTGLARYKEENEFLQRYQNRRVSNFEPDTPLGYERTKFIHLSNGARKIPAIQTTYRFWIYDEECKYTKNGFNKLTLGRTGIITQKPNIRFPNSKNKQLRFGHNKSIMN